MSHHHHQADDLPKSFVAAMKTLFDLMDDSRSGHVSLAEFESRWHDGNAHQSVPKGLIDSLRKVAPSNGSLTFDRFLVGLKLCLARNVSKPWANNKVYPAGPPKPPRCLPGVLVPPVPVAQAVHQIDKSEIRKSLQNWQAETMLNDNRRCSGDGKAKGRRREPRRHTLQNGIDYSMLKRMKQIEQEKDVLAMGLASVERARDWYVKQIGIVQDKMKYLGRMGQPEQWSEAHQERLELQRARVLEVNRHLAALTDSWERGGLPLHMNLAVHHHPVHNNHNNGHQQEMNARLKQQNHLLTEEVSKKSERISTLERERAALMRERTQSRNNGAQDEAVF